MLPDMRTLFRARRVVLIMLSAAYVYADCGAHDCLQGCALAVYEPVCGSDGITYGSSCFACCQGITSFTPGDCPGQDSTKALATAEEVQLAISAAAAAEAAGEADAITAAAIAAGMPTDMKLAAGPPSSISPQAMSRFATEGFRFVGIGKVNPKFKVMMPRIKPSRRSSASARVRRLVATRFLLDGTRFQYVAIMQANNVAGMRSAPSFQPPALEVSAEDASLQHAGGSEIMPASLMPQAVKVGIYGGKDDRTKVSDTTKFPYSTITDLTMWNYNAASKTWPYAGACSGAVVATKHILTAGHCVYDNGWVAGLIATPGKSANYNPWGQWWCSGLTTFEQWSKNHDGTYDMAVVTCKDQNKYKYDVGVAGWMGRNWGDAKHSGWKNTAGYPGDKYASFPSTPYGGFSVTQWQTSCQLPTADAVTDRIVNHPCDTVSGQSGSPIWDFLTSSGDRQIRGVVVRACDKTCTGSDMNQYTPLNRALGDAVNKIITA